MDYFVYNIDEYQPLEQGNEFAPIWPFRMVVAGSSDSGKTTMIMNLLMGSKKAKENGERYILCNDIILIGKHLDEPKWILVQEFYNELAESGEDVSFKSFSSTEIPDVSDFNSSRSSIVIFEDLVNEPKRIQEHIATYFTHGRHSNISPIYVTQRFYAVPKTIRENITYISLHRGGGSLSDIKKIISQYTEFSDTYAPIIDNLTLKREFIVFDLRRNKDDPLSIRVRWDTSLRSILDQSGINPGLDALQQNFVSDKNIYSKFSPYGQKVIAEAKKNNSLIDLAKKMPIPKERKLLLANGVITKKGDTWAKYVFREAFGINSKDLGIEWDNFSQQLKHFRHCTINRHVNKDDLLLQYQKLKESRPLDDKKFIEGCEILIWLFSNKHVDRKALYIGIKELALGCAP